MNEQKRLTSEERRKAIEALTNLLRNLPAGTTPFEAAEVTEAALRTVYPRRFHVDTYDVRMF